MTVREAIKAARASIGITQDDLAERTGISVWTLRDWEQGKSCPSLDDCHRIAKATEMELEDFVRGVDCPTGQREMRRCRA